MKIKIALSKDEVRILIKILVGDHWDFVQSTPNNPNDVTLENVGTDLGQCLVTA